MKKIVFIVIGIFCIIALYSIPVPVYPPPTIPSYVSLQFCSNYAGQQLYFPISTLASSVSNPLIIGGIFCGVMIGGSSYQHYTGLFYAGWIVGIICIFYGLSKR